jgi:hypothetical protein
VLALLDACDETGDVEGVGAECPERDQPMKDRGRDVRVVGRGPARADLAGVGREPYE